MSKEEDVLNSGTLYWFKSQRKGNVAVPLCYLTDEIDIKEAEKRRVSLFRDKFCEKEGLLRIAAEQSLEEIIAYLNFDHTKTLCNKCAYAEDRPFDKYY
jgi:hypothetical protein